MDETTHQTMKEPIYGMMHDGVVCTCTECAERSTFWHARIRLLVALRHLMRRIDQMESGAYI